MSSLVLGYWDARGELILGLRGRLGKPQVGEWTEYLVNEIKRVATKQHPELTNR